MTNGNGKRQGLRNLDIRVVAIMGGVGTSAVDALVLSQIHYWLSRTNNIYDDKHWTYQTYDQLAEQLNLASAAVVRKSVARLKAKGFIETCRPPIRNWNGPLWYRVDQDAVDAALDALPPGVAS